MSSDGTCPGCGDLDGVQPQPAPPAVQAWSCSSCGLDFACTVINPHVRAALVGRRFAPGEAAGLTLTLGVATVLALGVGFRELLDNVLDGEGIAVADRPVVWFLAAHRQPWLTTAARVITDMGSPVGVAVTAVVVGVALAWVPAVVAAATGLRARRRRHRGDQYDGEAAGEPGSPADGYRAAG